MFFVKKGTKKSSRLRSCLDRKSTRLNSSHRCISYAVFCLKKKKNACECYTSEFRQVSELESGEGKVTLSYLRSTSSEDSAGNSYRLNIDARMHDPNPSPVD